VIRSWSYSYEILLERSRDDLRLSTIAAFVRYDDTRDEEQKLLMTVTVLKGGIGVWIF